VHDTIDDKTQPPGRCELPSGCNRLHAPSIASGRICLARGKA